MKKTQFALSLVAMSVLAACGSDGDSGESPTGLVGYKECKVTITGLNPEFGVAGPTTIGVPESMSCADVQKQIDANITKANALIVARDAARTAATTAQADAATANAKVAALNADVGALTAQIASLQTQLAAAPTVAQVNALTAQIASLQAQLLASGDSAAMLAAATALKAEAAADKASADAARAQAAVDVAAAQAASLQAALDKATAETAAATAAADKAAADAATAAAAAKLAEAEAIVKQATADKTKAEADLAAAELTIAGLSNQIKLLQTALAAASTPEQVAVLQAQIEALTTRLATETGALNAQITALSEQIALLQNQLAAAPTQAQVDALTVRILSLEGQVNDLETALAAANTLPLPLCTPTPSPIGATTTFPGAGTTCVIGYADQIALAKAIADAASAVKYTGVYNSTEVIVVAEEDGKIWTFDQIHPDAVVGQITTSNGSHFSATSNSLGYSHREVVQVGDYDQGVQSAARLVYKTWVNPTDPDNVLTTATTSVVNVMYQGGTLAVPAGTMGGQDFYTGSHDVGLKVAADNTFTGAEGTCQFKGTFAPTTMSYNKVTITWGEGCLVPKDTVGTGVITKYGDNYLIMTNQAGQYSDVAFVSFFNPTWSLGTAVPANVPMSDKAKSLQASLKNSR